MPEPASLVRKSPFRKSMESGDGRERSTKEFLKPKMISFCVFQRPI